MTNLERIQHFSAAEMEKFLGKYRDMPMRDYIDMAAWLASDCRDYTFKGIKAEYDASNDGWIPCVIVEKTKLLKADYVIIIVNGQLVTVHAEKVREVATWD